MTKQEQSSSLELPRCEGGRRSQWKRCGLEEGVQFAILTDIIYKTRSDHSAKEYKRLKNLKKELEAKIGKRVVASLNASSIQKELEA